MEREGQEAGGQGLQPFKQAAEETGSVGAKPAGWGVTGVHMEIRCWAFSFFLRLSMSHSRQQTHERHV